MTGFRGLRIFAGVLLVSVCASAQRTMSAVQVTAFVKSSVEEKLDDRQVADVLRKTRLTDKLDERTVDELETLGAGPRTVSALRDLMQGSASLSKSAPVAAKAAPRRAMLEIEPAERTRILAAIREYALNYTQNLPNFICTQVTRRQEDLKGTGENWRQVDRVQEQLSYFDHHESYRVVMINGQMVNNKEHDKLGGAVSGGEFGSMLSEIFSPETDAEFEWAGVGKLDGRLMNVYRYRVPQSQSHYSIEERRIGKRIIAGYHGEVFANRETNAVMRITLQCEEIPADFPIQDVSIDMWYDVIKIAEQEFVLPLKWDMKSREGNILAWNTAELTLYRKYSADSAISFEAADPLPDSKTKEEPATPPVKKKQ